MAKHRVLGKLDLKVNIIKSLSRKTASTSFGSLLDQLTVALFSESYKFNYNWVLKATFAYIDDVIICGESKKDHDRNLQRFKEVASKYNLTLNIKFQYNLNKYL